MSGFGFGTRSGLHRASGSRNLPRITISAFALSEDALPGSTVGSLSVFAGNGTYIFTISPGGDPDDKFTLSGADLVTTDAFDFETASSHAVTIEADNGVDSPLSRTLIITVTNVFEQPSLGDLLLPALVGQGAAFSISGATAGSTLFAPVLPTGWTLDSASRTIDVAADAPIGAQNWTIIETLGDSENSPNVSSGSSTVEANNTEAPFVIIALAGQSNATGKELMGVFDFDRVGVFQFANNPNDPTSFETITNDTTPLMHQLNGVVEERQGPGAAFAEQLIANGFVPAGYRILLVPCARPGTGLADASEPWWPFAPEGSLFSAYVTQVNKAIAAAKELNPASHFAGTVMVQGERDAGRNRSTETYYSATSEFIAQTRAQITDAANAWIVWHSMTPERVASDNRFPPIQEAHIQLGANIANSFFFQAPTGRTIPGDTLHYSAQGAELNGGDIADLLPGWLANTIELGALSIPTTLSQGTSIAISGAIAGSTLSAISLPTGWTLDSANREIAIGSDAATGSQTFEIRETLQAASNSGRISSGVVDVQASGTTAPPPPPPPPSGLTDQFVYFDRLAGITASNGDASAWVADPDESTIAASFGDPGSFGNLPSVGSEAPTRLVFDNANTEALLTADPSFTGLYQDRTGIGFIAQVTWNGANGAVMYTSASTAGSAAILLRVNSGNWELFLRQREGGNSSVITGPAAVVGERTTVALFADFSVSSPAMSLYVGGTEYTGAAPQAGATTNYASIANILLGAQGSGGGNNHIGADIGSMAFYAQDNGTITDIASALLSDFAARFSGWETS